MFALDLSLAPCLMVGKPCIIRNTPHPLRCAIPVATCPCHSSCSTPVSSPPAIPSTPSPRPTTWTPGCRPTPPSSTSARRAPRQPCCANFAACARPCCSLLRSARRWRSPPATLVHRRSSASKPLSAQTRVFPWLEVRDGAYRMRMADGSQDAPAGRRGARQHRVARRFGCRACRTLPGAQLRAVLPEGRPPPRVVLGRLRQSRPRRAPLRPPPLR